MAESNVKRPLASCINTTTILQATDPGLLQNAFSSSYFLAPKHLAPSSSLVLTSNSYSSGAELTFQSRPTQIIHSRQIVRHAALQESVFFIVFTISSIDEKAKEGDRVYFNIGNNQEEGVVETVDYRDDGTAMATIRYELKSSGDVSHIHRNVVRVPDPS
ncbi:uncharacterized protein MEPE_02971 [Melanopsichium pennsylvanicum]|uniref:Uncharacterized protein n=1 Tax=Melanopsichium pennsylvanicum TaxID=63383 RepID=A0AAJ4XNH5_9BASI|nr:uncharacterized protein MEPE_02971 [Melanopsichium pennsylvanicum]